MQSTMLAGVLAGISGLLIFLIIHHFWISPIWYIAPIGLVIAGLGGVAVASAYSLLLPHLPPRPWTALAVVALIAVILAPAIGLSAVRPAVFDVVTGKLLPDMPVGVVVRRFVVELLLPSVVMGALAGWLIGQSRQAALATGLAGLVFALGPGHNIPLLAGTPAIPKGTALLFAPAIVAAIVLVEASRLLPGR